MRNRLRNLAVTALTVGAAFAGTAGAAQAYGGPHWCRVSGGSVQASANTSCAFAYNVAAGWDRYCGTDDYNCWGNAYSPVTGRWYHYYCYSGNPVFCRTNGNNSWIRFWIN